MNKTIDVRKPHCECPSTNLAPMCCITENGMTMTVSLCSSFPGTFCTYPTFHR